MKNRKPVNPFYILLLIAGITFGITACAYGVMTARELRSSRVLGAGFEPDPNASPSNFNELVDSYAPMAMICEIVLLGIGTVGAIAFDQHLDKKAQKQGETP